MQSRTFSGLLGGGKGMSKDPQGKVLDEPSKVAISAYGAARSTVEGAPLSSEELRKIDAYWRASLYLCLGMLYPKDNPLLLEPRNWSTRSSGCSGTGARMPARASPTSISTG